MEKEKNIGLELQETAPLLAKQPKVMPFNVPDGYFNTLSNSILSRCEGAKLCLAEAKIPYNAPKGFFNEFSDLLFGQLKALENTDAAPVKTELQSIAPTLAGIANTNVYTAPKGYFENVQLPAIQKQQAKVVAFRRMPTWLRYAALVGSIIILVKIFMPFTNSGKVEWVNPQAALQKISANEIEDYLSDNNATVNFTSMPNGNTNVQNNALLENITEKEISQFLQENSVKPE
jgi:hypothetical protein